MDCEGTHTFIIICVLTYASLLSLPQWFKFFTFGAGAGARARARARARAGAGGLVMQEFQCTDMSISDFIITAYCIIEIDNMNCILYNASIL